MWWEELSLFYKIKFVILAFVVCCVLFYMLCVLISVILHYIASKKATSNTNKKIDENIIERHYVLAKEYTVNKEWKKAIWEYTVLIKAYPENLDLLYRRAEAYNNDGQKSNAIKDYLDIVAINNQEVNAYLQLVNIYNSASNYQSAKDILKQAIQVIPNNEKINNAYNDVISILSSSITEEMAYKHFKQEEWEQAILDFSNLINLYPENITYLYARASVYTEIRDFEKAIYDYMKITELDPLEVNAYLYSAEIYNYAQQYEGTKQVLELALAVRPDDEEIKQAYNEVLNLLSEENILEKEPQANQKHIYNKRNKELQIKPKNKIGRKLDI